MVAAALGAEGAARAGGLIALPSNAGEVSASYAHAARNHGTPQICRQVAKPMQ